MSISPLKWCIFLEQTSQVRNIVRSIWHMTRQIGHFTQYWTQLLLIDGWLHLPDGLYFIWVRLDSLWSVQVTKESTFSLSNTFIKLSLMPALLVNSIASWQFLLIHFLFSKCLPNITYHYSTSSVLICLVSLSLERCPDWSSIWKAFSKFVPPKRCVESYHGQWYCIQLSSIPPLCLFLKKTL